MAYVKVTHPHKVYKQNGSLQKNQKVAESFGSSVSGSGKTTRSNS